MHALQHCLLVATHHVSSGLCPSNRSLQRVVLHFHIEEESITVQLAVRLEAPLEALLEEVLEDLLVALILA